MNDFKVPAGWVKGEQLLIKTMTIKNRAAVVLSRNPLASVILPPKVHEGGRGRHQDGEEIAYQWYFVWDEAYAFLRWWFS